MANSPAEPRPIPVRDGSATLGEVRAGPLVPSRPEGVVGQFHRL
jgi:hypothetical protein